MRLLAGGSGAHANAELGLGHLIQQSASSANRGSWRGSGFEALTQGWVTVHAAKGLLVSATARQGSYGSAQSTQMDAAEALAQLKGARELGLRMGTAAKAAGGHPLASFDDGESVPKWLDQVDPKKDGRHTGAVNGQQALKADAQRRTAAGDAVEMFASPVVLMDSPSAALLATEAGIALFAGQDLSFAVQGDVHQTAAHTWASVTGKTTSWYVHSGGVKVFAANGPVSLRAHTDALQIWADKDVTIISVNDQITISASSKIELIAGQSSVTLDGADIEFKTPGAFAVKGSGHAFLGGGSAVAELPRLPIGGISIEPTTMQLDHRYHDNAGVAGAEYVATFANGETRQGTLDGAGRATLTNVPGAAASVVFGPSTKKFERKTASPIPRYDPKPSPSKLESLIDRYAGALTKGRAGNGNSS